MTVRILVVVDLPAVAGSVAAVLRADSFTAWIARDGREAPAVLAAIPVGLVLSGIRMPGMGGVALAEKFHRLGDATPVVLIGAKGPPGPLPPGVDFLPKPFGPDVLFRAVRSALNTP